MRSRYLALGDSYTIGEGVEPDERWPSRVASMLRSEGHDLGEPEIIAVSGWTTDELAAGMDAAQPEGVYDVVSLLIGVNDQYRGRGVDSYRPRFTALLGRAVSHAGDRAGRVVVASIPDWGVSPFAEGRDRAEIAREIDEFNAAAKSVASAAGAHWVDVTEASRACDGAGCYGPDGLHPAGGAYAEWAKLIVPAFRRALAG